jgi:putative heme-binding domain-containing protein
MRTILGATVVAIVFTLSATVPADEPTIAPTDFRSPADELKSLRLPPGFEAQLVAAEPDIQKPINLAFDAKGRLWVTCTIEYPFPAAEGKGRDSVKVLSDFGPDGKAGKVETFADGLNIPIGVLPHKDGAIVYSIPNLWRMHPRTQSSPASGGRADGDGKADKREVLVSGFGHRDTHGMVNGLTMGFDGWVYCNHGYSNDSVATGTDGSVVRMNSGNVFRMKPDGSHVEMVCRGQVNPFGHCMDEFGNHYTSDCHSRAITQLIPGAVYSSFSKPDDGLGFGPDMVHAYRGATAIDGVCYYGADRFPEYYRNGLFIGEVVNNRVNFFTLKRNGGTYTATQQADFITSDDAWFRPVDIKLGPDGAIYIADFYNRIIGHYEVPLTHPGRDRTSGRIWRIVYKGTDGKAPPAKTPRADWTKANVAELIEDLGHPNLAVRMIGTHQLVERGQDAVAAIKATVGPTSSATARAHSLWVLERLGALDDKTVTDAANEKNLMVRVHALRILAERVKWTEFDASAVRIGLLSANDGLVRRVAAEALGRHPSLQSQRALLDAMGDDKLASDPFLRHTVRIALREQFRGVAEWTGIRDVDRTVVTDIALGLPEAGAASFVASQARFLPLNQRNRLPEYVHHVARYGEPERVDEFVGSLRLLSASTEPNNTAAIILSLCRGLQERGVAPPPATRAWALEECTSRFASNRADDLQLAIELAAALKSAPLYGNIVRILVDRQKPELVRIAAVNGLAAFDPKQSVGTLAFRLADVSESITFREKVAQSLAAANVAEARTALLNALPTAPARLASAIAAGLAGSADGAVVLLDAVAAGKASPRLLQERPVQVKLDALKRSEIAERVKTLTAGLPPADAGLAALLRKRAVQYAKAKPDVAAGRKVFEKSCATCHQIAGQGAKIGPQLDGIGVRGLDRLLEDVLDPNRNVDQSFRATTITLKNGQSLSGLVLREEGAVIVMADAQGKEQRVAKDQVAEREVSPLSPMPANWADQIAEKDFHDLMAYLLDQRGK